MQRNGGFLRRKGDMGCRNNPKTLLIVSLLGLFPRY